MKRYSKKLIVSFVVLLLVVPLPVFCFGRSKFPPIPDHHENPKGMVLEIVPFKIDNLPLPMFKFQVDNLIVGNEYYVVSANLLGGTSVAGHFIATSKTCLMSMTPGQRDLEELVQLFTPGVMEGEVMHVVLYSKDRKNCVHKTLVPYPKEVIGKHGAKLALEIHDPLGKFLMVRLEGFEPGEKLVWISKSCHEIVTGCHEHVLNSVILLKPGVIGKKGGPASFTVKGKNEELTVEYFWGDEMHKNTFPPNPLDYEAPSLAKEKLTLS